MLMMIMKIEEEKHNECDYDDNAKDNKRIMNER